MFVPPGWILGAPDAHRPGVRAASSAGTIFIVGGSGGAAKAVVAKEQPLSLPRFKFVQRAGPRCYPRRKVNEYEVGDTQCAPGLLISDAAFCASGRPLGS